ncbi:hypothetical protein B0T25DRAFT_546617, partial [Lasiosphaeria hispida]
MNSENRPSSSGNTGMSSNSNNTNTNTDSYFRPQRVALLVNPTTELWMKMRIFNEELQFAHERANPRNPGTHPILARERENMTYPPESAPGSQLPTLSETRKKEEWERHERILARLTGGNAYEVDPFQAAGWYKAYIITHIHYLDEHEVESFLPTPSDSQAQGHRRVRHFRRRMFCESLRMQDWEAARRWLNSTGGEVYWHGIKEMNRVATETGCDFNDMVRRGVGPRPHIVLDSATALMERDPDGNSQTGGVRWRPRAGPEPVVGRPRTVIPTTRYVVGPDLDELESL